MNTLSKYLISILLISLLFSNATGQIPRQSLFGAVVDAATGKPLPNANVFIAHSMMGAASDERGQFIIRNVPAGTFEIVASVIGYGVEKQTVQVTFPFQKVLLFKLQPEVVQLQEVVVSAAEKKKWQKNLDRFSELLLSTTENAGLTQIINPFVLEFPETKFGVFSATSKEPLIIENRALGYRLIYILQDFESTFDYVKFAGIPRFEELEPNSTEELEMWQQNRNRAYLGSLRHFLSELCNNFELTRGDTGDVEFMYDFSDVVDGKPRMEYKKGSYLKTKGFETLWMSNPWHGPKITQLVNTNRLLSPGQIPTERFLKFNNYLQIRYKNEMEESNYLRDTRQKRDPGPQVSWITLESDSVAIDVAGRYFDTYKIKTSGYWAWERLADMLPLEFEYTE